MKMTPLPVHQEAVGYAFEADMAKVRGAFPARAVALSRALALEICAATMLYSRLDCEPTRSILFRSAATLAMRSGEFGCARELALIGLGGHPDSGETEYLEELVEAADNESIVGYGFVSV